MTNALLHHVSALEREFSRKGTLTFGFSVFAFGVEQSDLGEEGIGLGMM
jgi:hypothetical protein